MSYSHRPSGAPTWARGVVRQIIRFLRDEAGAELIQFALAIPIMMALVWSSFELWQIMTLRAAVRSTVAQAARYVTAYGALPVVEGDEENPDAIPIVTPAVNPADVCWQVEQLVGASLERHRGILGDALTWNLRWYRIEDPLLPQWEGNAVEVSCLEWLPEDSPLPFQCRDQFGLELEVSVPWQTVIFGLEGTSAENFVLRMSDRAVGSSPCLPYCYVAAGWNPSGPGGPEGCRGYVSALLDCSYEPHYCEIYIDNQLVDRVDRNLTPGTTFSSRNVNVDVGPHSIEVICYGRSRKTEDSASFQCEE